MHHTVDKMYAKVMLHYCVHTTYVLSDVMYISNTVKYILTWQSGQCIYYLLAKVILVVGKTLECL